MNEEKLIYASTEKSADMLYFAKMNIPDPFFAFTHGGKKCALMSPLEFGRAAKQSDFDTLYPSGPRSDAEELAKLLRKLGVGGVEVPSSFPVSEYLALKGLGVRISVCGGEFFPQRRVKDEREIAEIKKANAAAAASYARVVQILREAEENGGALLWRSKPLTSETLKYEIELACLAMGASSEHTIAAGGDQACDPHNEGSGPIRARELLVVDIFPRMKSSGYFGDMTRTFIKGRPTDAQARIVSTVRKAQLDAISRIRAGAIGASVHSAVAGFFEREGFGTEFEGGAWRGFFHSTGHGIGLEVHEEPRLGRQKNALAENEVVTVEPGLYYPGVGACRIEDNVRVLKDGCEILSDFNYDWIID